ncbi:MAG: RNA polymerase subunit sigma [Deltaproteobacteria bacterium]|nr:MAG: RNA polymerase subunit sigma [Deltaproteobacteria bacterium]
MNLLDQAADIIIKGKFNIALTGAGISVESGIPDFRSKGGLWTKYDPSEYATIEAFKRDPEKVWKMIKEMDELLEKAKPNKAHIGLADLEKMGLLHGIITQNVDNLHQEAGSSNVIEYHGTSKTLSCLWCGRRYKKEEKRGEYPPKCECGRILKPDIVFFGEPIPQDAMAQSFQMASKADVLLVIGTSAVVSPANTIPSIAKQNGAKIIEINKESTWLTDSVTDIFLQGSAGKIISELVDIIKNKRYK